MKVVTLVLCLFLAGCSSPLSQMRDAALVTHGDDAPTYIPPTRDDCGQQLDVLFARVGQFGLKFEYFDDKTKNVLGRFYGAEWMVQIQPGLTSCGSLEVLSHELAHAITPDYVWEAGMAEPFADAVSLLVVNDMAHYNPAAKYGHYWAKGKIKMAHVGLYKPEIDRAVRIIVKGKGA